MLIRILLVFSCIALGSCDYRGMSTFKKICKEDSRFTIHETVFVDGYYDNVESGIASMRAIVNRGFAFVEFQSRNTYGPISGAKENNIGFWRMERDLKNSESCNESFQNQLAVRVDDIRVKKFVENYCIKLTKIAGVSELKSEYGYFLETERRTLPNKLGSEIIKETDLIKRLGDNKEMATKVVYRLVPHGPILDDGARISCTSARVATDERRNLREETFKPNTMAQGD